MKSFPPLPSLAGCFVRPSAVANGNVLAVPPLPPFAGSGAPTGETGIPNALIFDLAM
jgi:hypothetical protein